jgi:hypothetical protein
MMCSLTSITCVNTDPITLSSAHESNKSRKLLFETGKSDPLVC